MSGWRLILFLCLGALVAGGATLLAVRHEELPEKTAPAMPPPRPPVDAAQIATGRIAMERMPKEVGASLETFSDEIVKNAEALEGKQARITGTCAPGSAIRVIGEDGTVRCQQLPRGVVSVTAAAAIPRASSTASEIGVVKGAVGRFQSAGEDDYLIAPVVLPDGATVTSFSFTYLDNSLEQDAEAYLYRSDDQSLAVISSEGADEHVRTAATDQVHLPRIDAARFGYFVYFKTSTSAGPQLMPISASISYRLP